MSVHDHLYGCPQTLFKFHPEFDRVLADILTQDPSSGRLILLKWRHPQVDLNSSRCVLDEYSENRLDRVHFLPRQTWPEFMSLTAGVDVLLNPMHFGGRTTTNERSCCRIAWLSHYRADSSATESASLCDHVGITETLVESGTAYSELAVRLGTDQDYRKDLRQRILVAKDVLFEDVSGIRQLEAFWEQALEHNS